MIMLIFIMVLFSLILKAVSFGLEKYYDGLLLRIPSMKDPSVLPEMTRQDKMFEIFKAS